MHGLGFSCIEIFFGGQPSLADGDGGRSTDCSDGGNRLPRWGGDGRSQSRCTVWGFRALRFVGPWRCPGYRPFGQGTICRCPLVAQSRCTVWCFRASRFVGLWRCPGYRPFGRGTFCCCPLVGHSRCTVWGFRASRLENILCASIYSRSSFFGRCEEMMYLCGRKQSTT